MPVPSIGLLENAANAEFWSSATATAYDLTQLAGSDGTPLEVMTASGCTAGAFTDGQGNIIIAFQGTTTKAQAAADQQIMAGDPGSSIGALQDALSFTRSVEQTAAGLGIPATSIYVTGHSLGGTLAEYVASQTGLAGVSFAGSGLPGYVAPGTPAANFTSYVEHGDAFANWSSDGSEHVLVNGSQDHYGKLVFLGPPANDAMTSLIVSDVAALLPAAFTGTLNQAETKLGNDFAHNLMTIHGMNFYQADIGNLPPPNLSGPAFSTSDPHSAMTHLFAKL